MKRLLPILTIGVVLALAGGLFYTFAAPTLVSFEPDQATNSVRAGTPIRLTFSTAMQSESVLERLVIEPAVEGEYSWDGNSLVFTPKSFWSGGTEVSVHLSPGSQASGFISLPMRQDVLFNFTISQPRLVYLYPAAGLADLYTVQPETGDKQRITEVGPGVLDFDASPIENAIYFSVRNLQGGSDVYRLDLNQADDESGVSLVLECLQSECRMPRISPGGKYLAYEKTIPLADGGTGYPQVWISSLDETGKISGESLLVGDPAHQSFQPDWSNNGLLAFYDPSLKAYVFYNPGQGEVSRFANETGEIGDWSPDGKAYLAPEIFYIDSNLPSVGTDAKPLDSSRLLQFLLESNKVQDLTISEDLEDISPAYSPDGLMVAFARRFLNITKWTPGRQLWIMSLGADSLPVEVVQLSNEPFQTHYDFAWSPEGDRLAYVRFDQTKLTKPPEIWIIDLLSGDTKLLVIGGYSPKWMP